MIKISNYKKYFKRFTRVSNILNKALFIVFLLCIGVMVIYALDPNRGKSIIIKTDNNSGGNLIECPQTETANLEKVTISAINIVDKISSIDYSSTVLAGANQKNLVAPLTKPHYSTYEQLGSCLDNDRQVIVVATDNITRIYPIAILDYHIVINDVIGNQPVAVVYTPTSGMINVFNSMVKSSKLTFGHTGSLYKNTDLLVDFASDTLWSARTGEALVGMMAGARLQKLDFKVMNYGAVKSQYPKAQVVNFQTGFRRNYGVDPFVEFKNNNLVPQELSNQSNVLEIKELVLGFTYNNRQYALSTSKLKAAEFYSTQIGEEQLNATYSNGEYTISIRNLSTREVKPINFEFMFWFVWYDYNPDTTVL